MSVKLAHQTQKTAGIGNGMRTATIAAVSGSAITITVSGGSFSAGVGVVTSYAPIVGDTVAVFRQDSSWLILGPLSNVNGWTTFTSIGYQNAWTDRGNPYPVGQFRRTASEVQIVGQITNASIQGAGAAIVAGLPAPSGEVGGIICAQGTSRPSLHVDAAGVLRIYDSSTTGILQLCGSYPIDLVIA
jgi:hypothetical protein